MPKFSDFQTGRSIFFNFTKIQFMISSTLFISGPEILFVVLAIVLFFGTDKLPEIVRGLGQGIRYLRNATDDLKSEVMDEVDKEGFVNEIKEDVQSIKTSLKKEVEGIVDPINKKDL